MIIIGGPAANGIDSGLAKALKARLIRPEIKTFPDGETLVRINASLKNKDVVIVQSTYTPQEKHLLQLLFVADLAKRLGARKIIAVIPYLAYARQNESFRKGEAISIETVMKMLSASGISKIITVEPHKTASLRHFKGEAIAVSPAQSLMQEVKKEHSRLFVIAPDKGGINLAKKAAKILGCDYTYIDKERDLATGSVRIKKTTDKRFDGKEVVIVDDIISSGGTIAQASRLAYSRGAVDVCAAAVHLVMIGRSYHRIRESGVSKIYGTNTIPFERATVADVSEEIAHLLKNR